ncbi:MAG: ABC transporter substrate-binding protein [Steroidobacteraceae bacterium]
MEWIDPVYCSGHWIPEVAELAGGVDALGRKHQDSQRIEWQQVLEWQPEVLVIMPCGFAMDKAMEHAQAACSYPGWLQLPAVRNNRVYVVDANSYFARPGPRLIEGVELLAHLFHPEHFTWHGPADAFCKLDTLVV